MLLLATLIQNYLSQVSAADVSNWHLHEWTRAILNVVLATVLVAKAFFTDSTPPSKTP